MLVEDKAVIELLRVYVIFCHLKGVQFFGTSVQDALVDSFWHRVVYEFATKDKSRASHLRARHT